MRNLEVYPTEKIFRDEMSYLFLDAIEIAKLHIEFFRNGESVRIEARSFNEVLKGKSEVYKPEYYYDLMKYKHENTKHNLDLFYAIVDKDGWATLMYYDVKDFFYTYKFSDGKVLHEVLDECAIEY